MTAAQRTLPKWLWHKIGLLLVAASLPAQAERIPMGYRQIAAEYAVPARLFYAVALTESRRATHSGHTLPWPWSLNVEGQTLRFPSRKAAWSALQSFLNQGTRRVDIGLMQINWHYHSERLGSAWRALDPYHNLRVGAQILREQYNRSGDWLVAAGRYHNPGTTPRQQRLAAAYRKRVTAMLQQIGDSPS